MIIIKEFFTFVAEAVLVMGTITIIVLWLTWLLRKVDRMFFE